MLPDPARLQTQPLWAQVLLASRATRRGAVLALPASPGGPLARLWSACDALDRCAGLGCIPAAERVALRRARDWQPIVSLHTLSLAIQAAISAAVAAEAALDVAAAEPACERSAQQALASALELAGPEDRRAHQEVETDLRALLWLCQQSGVGRYEPIPAVIATALPAIAPSPNTQPTPVSQENHG